MGQIIVNLDVEMAKRKMSLWVANLATYLNIETNNHLKKNSDQYEKDKNLQ